MPPSKQRSRFCKECNLPFILGENNTLHKYCSIECRTKWHYSKWKSNGGFRNKEKRKSYYLKFTYGISLDQFNSLLTKQNNCCAICNRVSPTGYNWHVDHCHKTGRIRGILCSKCNQGLGMFEENIISIKKAIEYLDNFTN